MVSINFTIVVQLVLFVIFLWVANKIVFRPITNVMDRRAETNQENLESAERDAEQAEALEADYAAQIASARRESVVTVEKARREALNERMQAIASCKQETEEQVTAVRDEATEHLTAARSSYGQLAPGLVADIAGRLNVELGPEGPGGQKGSNS